MHTRALVGVAADGAVTRVAGWPAPERDLVAA